LEAEDKKNQTWVSNIATLTWEEYNHGGPLSVGQPGGENWGSSSGESKGHI